MAQTGTYSNNLVINLFHGNEKTNTAKIPATQMQLHNGKVISFLMDRYQPTAFEIRLENDNTSDYPRYYFGKAVLCDETGKPHVQCQGESFPLKKNDYVFDSETLACTYGGKRLVSVSTYLPKSFLNDIQPQASRAS